MKMCGITGWINWRQNIKQEYQMVEKMAQTLEKRGPDAAGLFKDNHVVLGHRRLIVVDPAGGEQPMTRKSKSGESFTIVYNGELYNTEDLRKELLSRGYRFESHSDTEVLLTAYMEWREESVEKLNGIYAFAIWEHDNERLFMARDRFGVKPLFYKHEDGKLLFGSEIKAILAHPSVRAEVDREGLQEVFGLGPSRTPGHGVYKGINELRPAFYLIFDRNGLKVNRYWNVVSREHTDSLEDTIEQVRFLVKDSVERQLVSDVPLCTFLSGGLDSSSISAISSNYFKEHGRETLHTYSIDYENNSQYFQSSLFQPDEDRPWIEKMTEYLGSIHHSKVITHEKLVEELEEAVFARDLPGMADIDSSLLWFSKEIKKNFTVALSGECADEVFGGYPWFHQKERLLADGFPWMHSVGEREKLLLPHWQNKLNLKEYIHARYIETLKEVPRLDGEDQIANRRRELFYLNMLWFMATLLERKDRMSMSASLEVRVPFADHRLVEYVWNIPWEMKSLGGREKGILRKAMEGILPDSIIYRKKSPYPKTHHPVYLETVKNILQKVLDTKGSPLFELVSRDMVQEIIDSNGSSFKVPWFGQLMTGPQLIAHLVQINTWLDRYNVNIVD